MDGLSMKYFVLKPKAKDKVDRYAQASRVAMRAYADYIHAYNPELSFELRKWAQIEYHKEINL